MSTVEKTWRNYVGGEWVESLSGDDMPVINPATEDVIARVPSGAAADVDRAVQAAHAARTSWSDTTPAERAAMLLTLADRLEAQADDFGRLESLNAGKPLHSPTSGEAQDALATWITTAANEMVISADNLRFFAGAARVMEGRAAGEYMRGYTSAIRREPIGVASGIVPWNYPLFIALWKIAPAVVAGNVVVVKPAEETPLTALKLAELIHDVFPPGVVNIVTGAGETVGDAIVRHPGIDMVSMTGSAETGKLVAERAAGTLKRVHLELGGNAPVVILSDADVKAAAHVVKLGGFVNTGQDCGSACRVLVDAAIYDDFMAELANAVEDIKYGDPADGVIDMGPVISERQYRRVLQYLDRADANGARVVTGGSAPDRPGYFIEPTVVTNVEQTATIVQEEVFGPVVTVQRFTGDDEAISMANDVPYGLAASVHTNDLRRANRFSRALRFGTVWINDHIPVLSEMPWGGFKASGYGKDMSAYALEEYTQIKHVMTRWGH